MSPSSKPAHVITAAPSRRDVLRALGLGAGLSLLAPLALRGSSVAHAASSARMLGIGRIGLDLDGAFTPLDGATGGNAFADVGIDPPVDGVQRKHLSSVHFEDLVIQVPVGSSQALAGWIAATLSKGPQAKSGALVYLDPYFKEVKRLEFSNAVITEVALPACDASTPTRGDMNLTLRLAPTETRLAGGTGRTVNSMASKNPAAMVSPASFRMNVQGLEQACRSIRTVSAPSIKRTMATVPARSEAIREKPLAAALLDCATVSLTMAESEAGPFYQWFNDFALRANNTLERPGRLEYLSTDMARAVATVDFGNLGILRYAPLAAGDAASGSASVALVQVDMFCETLSLTVA